MTTLEPLTPVPQEGRGIQSRTSPCRRLDPRPRPIHGNDQVEKGPFPPRIRDH
ncbi:hypothetical protein BJX96DRAFT_145015 [Aspergillus floccosus]